ncbi:MAG: transglycosylase domain-containing protein [Prevotella sp.]|nr:transglycosylase domain-containing protein [Prevotella sp.]
MSFIWNQIKRGLSWLWNAFKRAGSWYVHLFKGRPWWAKILSALATLVVLFILYLGAVDINAFGLFGKSPSIRTILNTRPAQASEVYSADSVMIGKYWSENRMPVTYDDVNPVFWHALIDTEDERFYRHIGIDFPAFFAALKDYIVSGDARGASTITQQLAKNLFRVRTEYSTGLLGKIPGLAIVIMKTKEWITALKLEAHFSKNEILTMYANTVDFGSNAYGIKTACRTYFGIMPKDLKAEQAAVLVGMLKATTTYNPRLHPENSKARRNVVLANMVLHGHLTQSDYNRLSQEDISLDYDVENIYDGEASYFRVALAQQLKGWCQENGFDLYTDGLKIYTTLDTRMQRYAEKAALTQMKKVQENFKEHWAGTTPWRDERYQEIPNFIENIAKRSSYYRQLEKRFEGDQDSIWYYMNKPHSVKLFTYDGMIEKDMSTMDSIRYMVRYMHCGFVAIEPLTGYVKAWVGDIDFNSWKYDKVTANRQPGSTFKLFVYTEAMNQGLTPCDTRVDSYYRMSLDEARSNRGRVWVPHNANGYVTGSSMTLKRAFAKSVNTIAAKLGQEVGIDRVIYTAHQMGIKSQLEKVPSLALGSSDVNLLELVNAYTTIINDGKAHEPVMVTRILDRDGNEIYKDETEQKQVVTYRTAFFMQQLLMGGLSGTSYGLQNYIRQFAERTDFGGKTGTSNNHSDAWFVGVSPKLVCGAWVGGEYRAIHFRTGALGQGGKTALPICGQFFESVLSDPQFQYYHGKFAPVHGDEIRENMYECTGYYGRRDSLMSDSLVFFDIPDLNSMDEYGDDEEAPASVPAEGQHTGEHSAETGAGETPANTPATTPEE